MPLLALSCSTNTRMSQATATERRRPVEEAEALGSTTRRMRPHRLEPGHHR